MPHAIALSAVAFTAFPHLFANCRMSSLITFTAAAVTCISLRRRSLRQKAYKFDACASRRCRVDFCFDSDREMFRARDSDKMFIDSLTIRQKCLSCRPSKCIFLLLRRENCFHFVCRSVLEKSNVRREPSNSVTTENSFRSVTDRNGRENFVCVRQGKEK